MLIVYAPIIVAFLYVIVLRDVGFTKLSLPEPTQPMMVKEASERNSTVARARAPPVELIH